MKWSPVYSNDTKKKNPYFAMSRIVEFPAASD